MEIKDVKLCLSFRDGLCSQENYGYWISTPEPTPKHTSVDTDFISTLLTLKLDRDLSCSSFFLQLTMHTLEIDSPFEIDNSQMSFLLIKNMNSFQFDVPNIEVM
ncbi:hypothetical protein BLOT_005446 [Blomia tropicalis]|nr:hypothetical protein BLOT_005446 [Blomia tropicalis]